MTTQLFPLPLFFFSLAVNRNRRQTSGVSGHTEAHSVLITPAWTPILHALHLWCVCWIILFICTACHSQENQQKAFLQAHIERCCICAGGQKCRSGENRNIYGEWSESIVGAYRAAFILRGPCIPASTVSRTPALGSLLVWWTVFPTSQTGLSTFWPWCQQSQTEAAESHASLFLKDMWESTALCVFLLMSLEKNCKSHFL